MCLHCNIQTSGKQTRLATNRTRRDWELVTDPVATELLEFNRMPEQIPGPTRAALRAFQQSADSTAVVAGISAGTLNQSIRVLGLGAEMYAETRGTETVLRRSSAVAS